MKTALLHHWLNGMRGGEKVLESFCSLYPHADIFTLFYNSRKVSQTIASHKIEVSRLNRNPLYRRLYNNLFPLFPYTTEQFNLSDYDLVLGSDTLSMKGVITSPDTCHISYCHTPPRYVWDLYHEYLDNTGLGKMKRLAAKLMLHTYRQWDVVAANRVDYFIANSSFVARRIAKFYRRPAAVINPPVEFGRFTPGEPQDYYLALGQLVPYKRIDLLVEAFGRMPNRRLKVVGTGPMLKALRKNAGSNVEFVGYAAEKEKLAQYQGCRAFLFPGIEDYGITPLEAQACGRPVVAFGRGGVLDTVKGVRVSEADSFDADEHTGLYFDSPSVESLMNAIVAFEANVEPRADPTVIRNHAQKFDVPAFENKIREFVQVKQEEFVRLGPPVR